MKSKVLYFILTIGILFSSCTSSYYVSEKQVQQVQLNMSKENIVSILGNRYETIHLSQNDEGSTIEILGYSSLYGGIYKLLLEKGRLTRIDKEQPYEDIHNCNSVATPTIPVVSSDNSAMKAHLDAHRNAMLSGASSDSERASINSHIDAHSKAVLGE